MNNSNYVVTNACEKGNIRLYIVFKFWIKMFSVIVDNSFPHKTNGMSMHEDCMIVPDVILEKQKDEMHYLIIMCVFIFQSKERTKKGFWGTLRVLERVNWIIGKLK